MKPLSNILVIITIGCVLAGCINSTHRIAELEEIIKKQEGEITQLQAKLGEKQEETELIRSKIGGGQGSANLKPEKTSQSENNPVTKAIIRERKTLYDRVIYTGGDVVKIYFDNFKKFVGFFAYRPGECARADLDTFLVTSGRETGTIEYYSSSGTTSQKKVYVITGSLTSEEIETPLTKKE